VSTMHVLLDVMFTLASFGPLYLYSHSSSSSLLYRLNASTCNILILDHTYGIQCINEDVVLLRCIYTLIFFRLRHLQGCDE